MWVYVSIDERSSTKFKNHIFKFHSVTVQCIFFYCPLCNNINLLKENNKNCRRRRSEINLLHILIV